MHLPTPLHTRHAQRYRHTHTQSLTLAQAHTSAHKRLHSKHHPPISHPHTRTNARTHAHAVSPLTSHVMSYSHLADDPITEKLRLPVSHELLCHSRHLSRHNVWNHTPESERRVDKARVTGEQDGRQRRRRGQLVSQNSTGLSTEPAQGPQKCPVPQQTADPFTVMLPCFCNEKRKKKI